MINHIIKIYLTCDKLTLISEEIKEKHLSDLLLCSLPGSYDTLITALEGRNEDELTLEFIKSKLIDEYTKHTDKKGSENTNVNSALKVHHQKSKTNKFCRYCHKTSHNIEDCWRLKNKNKERFSPKGNNKNKSYKSYKP